MNVLSVVDTKEVDGNIVIMCEDRYTEGDTPPLSSVVVEKTPAAQCVQTNDKVWWDFNNVMWTPRKEHFKDYKLKRVAVKQATTSPSLNSIQPTCTSERVRN